MATITYPNVNVQGYARPDIAATRFIEFDVDMTKVTAAAGDVIVIGKATAGSVILAAQTMVFEPSGTASTFVVSVGSTSLAADTNVNAAKGTIVGGVTPISVNADANITVTVGTNAVTKGKFRVVLLVSEMNKPAFPGLAPRDQSLV